MAEFHFIRPWFLLSFIPFLVILYRLAKRGSSQNSWQQACDPHLLRALMTQVAKNYYWLSFWAIFLCGSLMIVALAGPAWQKLPQPSFAQKKATVIVLDMSDKMNAQDIKPSRLQRAKFKIEDLLKSQTEGQVGLVVFTKEAFLVSPLTKDKRTLNAFLAELSTNIMPVAGANIGSGLKMAAKLIKQASYPTGNIVLFTASKPTSQDLSIAKTLRREGLHLSVIGMATKLGAPIFDNYGIKHMTKLEQDSLKTLASDGQGQYQSFTSSDQDIKALTTFINQEKSDYKKQNDNMTIWQDEGRYLILFLLPLVLLAFRRGFIESITS